MLKRKPKVLTPEQAEEIYTKDFFDCILPGVLKFQSDHYIVGDSYRCVWAIREYPPSTEEQAILSQLADRSGVTLRIYHRLVESMEQRKIIQNATRRNKLKSGGTDVNETIEAEGNFGITDSTDYSTKKPSDFPVMEDFYKLCEEEFMTYDRQRKYLYTEETLQEVCLGIHSMCVGAESKYFNGHSNITESDFLGFGVKGLMDTNKRLKDAIPTPMGKTKW